MPRPKRSQNIVTERLIVTEFRLNRIDVDAMTTDQKLKLLQLSLHYVLPKLRSKRRSTRTYSLD